MKSWIHHWLNAVVQQKYFPDIRRLENVGKAACVFLLVVRDGKLFNRTGY